MKNTFYLILSFLAWLGPACAQSDIGGLPRSLLPAELNVTVALDRAPHPADFTSFALEVYRFAGEEIPFGISENELDPFLVSRGRSLEKVLGGAQWLSSQGSTPIWSEQAINWAKAFRENDARVDQDPERHVVKTRLLAQLQGLPASAEGPLEIRRKLLGRVWSMAEREILGVGNLDSTQLQDALRTLDAILVLGRACARLEIEKEKNADGFGTPVEASMAKVYNSPGFLLFREPTAGLSSILSRERGAVERSMKKLERFPEQKAVFHEAAVAWLEIGKELQKLRAEKFSTLLSDDGQRQRAARELSADVSLLNMLAGEYAKLPLEGKYPVEDDVVVRVEEFIGVVADQWTTAKDLFPASDPLDSLTENRLICLARSIANEILMTKSDARTVNNLGVRILFRAGIRSVRSSNLNEDLSIIEHTAEKISALDDPWRVILHADEWKTAIKNANVAVGNQSPEAEKALRKLAQQQWSSVALYWTCQRVIQEASLHLARNGDQNFSMGMINPRLVIRDGRASLEYTPTLNVAGREFATYSAAIQVAIPDSVVHPGGASDLSVALVAPAAALIVEAHKSHSAIERWIPSTSWRRQLGESAGVDLPVLPDHLELAIDRKGGIFLEATYIGDQGPLILSIGSSDTVERVGVSAIALPILKTSELDLLCGEISKLEPNSPEQMRLAELLGKKQREIDQGFQQLFEDNRTRTEVLRRKLMASLVPAFASAISDSVQMRFLQNGSGDPSNAKKYIEELMGCLSTTLRGINLPTAENSECRLQFDTFVDIEKLQPSRASLFRGTNVRATGVIDVKVSAMTVTEFLKQPVDATSRVETLNIFVPPIVSARLALAGVTGIHLENAGSVVEVLGSEDAKILKGLRLGTLVSDTIKTFGPPSDLKFMSFDQVYIPLGDGCEFSLKAEQVGRFVGNRLRISGKLRVPLLANPLDCTLIIGGDKTLEFDDAFGEQLSLAIRRVIPQLKGVSFSNVRVTGKGVEFDLLNVAEGELADLKSLSPLSRQSIEDFMKRKVLDRAVTNSLKGDFALLIQFYRDHNPAHLSGLTGQPIRQGALSVNYEVEPQEPVAARSTVMVESIRERDESGPTRLIQIDGSATEVKVHFVPGAENALLDWVKALAPIPRDLLQVEGAKFSLRVNGEPKLDLGNNSFEISIPVLAEWSAGAARADSAELHVKIDLHSPMPEIDGLETAVARITADFARVKVLAMVQQYFGSLGSDMDRIADFLESKPPKIGEMIKLGRFFKIGEEKWTTAYSPDWEKARRFAATLPANQASLRRLILAVPAGVEFSLSCTFFGQPPIEIKEVKFSFLGAERGFQFDDAKCPELEEAIRKSVQDMVAGAEGAKAIVSSVVKSGSKIKFAVLTTVPTPLGGPPITVESEVVLDPYSGISFGTKADFKTSLLGELATRLKDNLKDPFIFPGTSATAIVTDVNSVEGCLAIVGNVNLDLGTKLGERKLAFTASVPVFADSNPRKFALKINANRAIAQEIFSNLLNQALASASLDFLGDGGPFSLEWKNPTPSFIFEKGLGVDIPVGIRVFLSAKMTLAKGAAPLEVGLPNLIIDRHGVRTDRVRVFSLKFPRAFPPIPVPPVAIMLKGGAIGEFERVVDGKSKTVREAAVFADVSWPKFEKVLTLDGELRFDLEHVGNIGMQARLKAMSIELGTAKGEILVSSGKVSGEADIGGPVSAFVHGRARFKAETSGFDAHGDFRILSLFNDKVDASFEKESSRLVFTARQSILGSNRDLKFDSTPRFESPELSAAFSAGSVAGINIGSVEMAQSVSRMRASFDVLGFRSHIVLPSFFAFDKALDELIKRLLSPKLPDLGKAIDAVLSGNLDINPMSGFGRGGDGMDGGNDGGAGGDGGGGEHSQGGGGDTGDGVNGAGASNLGQVASSLPDSPAAQPNPSGFPANGPSAGANLRDIVEGEPGFAVTAEQDRLFIEPNAKMIEARRLAGVTVGSKLRIWAPSLPQYPLLRNRGGKFEPFGLIVGGGVELPWTITARNDPDDSAQSAVGSPPGPAWLAQAVPIAVSSAQGFAILLALGDQGIDRQVWVDGTGLGWGETPKNMLPNPLRVEAFDSFLTELALQTASRPQRQWDAKYEKLPGAPIFVGAYQTTRFPWDPGQAFKQGPNDSFKFEDAEKHQYDVEAVIARFPFETSYRLFIAYRRDGGKVETIARLTAEIDRFLPGSKNLDGDRNEVARIIREAIASPAVAYDPVEKWRERKQKEAEVVTAAPPQPPPIETHTANSALETGAGIVFQPSKPGSPEFAWKDGKKNVTITSDKQTFVLPATIEFGPDVGDKVVLFAAENDSPVPAVPAHSNGKVLSAIVDNRVVAVGMVSLGEPIGLSRSMVRLPSDWNSYDHSRAVSQTIRDLSLSRLAQGEVSSVGVDVIAMPDGIDPDSSKANTAPIWSIAWANRPGGQGFLQLLRFVSFPDNSSGVEEVILLGSDDILRKVIALEHRAILIPRLFLAGRRGGASFASPLYLYSATSNTGELSFVSYGAGRPALWRHADNDPKVFYSNLGFLTGASGQGVPLPSHLFETWGLHRLSEQVLSKKLAELSSPFAPKLTDRIYFAAPSKEKDRAAITTIFEPIIGSAEPKCYIARSRITLPSKRTATLPPAPLGLPNDTYQKAATQFPAILEQLRSDPSIDFSRIELHLDVGDVIGAAILRHIADVGSRCLLVTSPQSTDVVNHLVGHCRPQLIALGSARDDSIFDNLVAEYKKVGIEIRRASDKDTPALHIQYELALQGEIDEWVRDTAAGEDAYDRIAIPFTRPWANEPPQAGWKEVVASGLKAKIIRANRRWYLAMDQWDSSRIQAVFAGAITPSTNTIRLIALRNESGDPSVSLVNAWPEAEAKQMLDNSEARDVLFRAAPNWIEDGGGEKSAFESAFLRLPSLIQVRRSGRAPWITALHVKSERQVEVELMRMAQDHEPGMIDVLLSNHNLQGKLWLFTGGYWNQNCLSRSSDGKTVVPVGHVGVPDQPWKTTLLQKLLEAKPTYAKSFLGAPVNFELSGGEGWLTKTFPGSRIGFNQRGEFWRLDIKAEADSEKEGPPDHLWKTLRDAFADEAMDSETGLRRVQINGDLLIGSNRVMRRHGSDLDPVLFFPAASATSDEFLAVAAASLIREVPAGLSLPVKFRSIAEKEGRHVALADTTDGRTVAFAWKTGMSFPASLSIKDGREGGMLVQGTDAETWLFASLSQVLTLILDSPTHSLDNGAELLVWDFPNRPGACFLMEAKANNPMNDAKSGRAFALENGKVFEGSVTGLIRSGSAITAALDAYGIFDHPPVVSTGESHGEIIALVTCAGASNGLLAINRLDGMRLISIRAWPGFEQGGANILSDPDITVETLSTWTDELATENSDQWWLRRLESGLLAMVVVPDTNHTPIDPQIPNNEYFSGAIDDVIGTRVPRLHLKRGAWQTVARVPEAWITNAQKGDAKIAELGLRLLAMTAEDHLGGIHFAGLWSKPGSEMLSVVTKSELDRMRVVFPNRSEQTVAFIASTATGWHLITINSFDELAAAGMRIADFATPSSYLWSWLYSPTGNDEPWKEPLLAAWNIDTQNTFSWVQHLKQAGPTPPSDRVLMAGTVSPTGPVRSTGPIAGPLLWQQIASALGERDKVVNWLCFAGDSGCLVEVEGRAEDSLLLTAPVADKSGTVVVAGQWHPLWIRRSALWMTSQASDAKLETGDPRAWSGPLLELHTKVSEVDKINRLTWTEIVLLNSNLSIAIAGNADDAKRGISHIFRWDNVGKHWYHIGKPEGGEPSPGIRHADGLLVGATTPGISWINDPSERLLLERALVDEQLNVSASEIGQEWDELQFLRAVSPGASILAGRREDSWRLWTPEQTWRVNIDQRELATRTDYVDLLGSERGAANPTLRPNNRQILSDGEKRQIARLGVTSSSPVALTLMRNNSSNKIVVQHGADGSVWYLQDEPVKLGDHGPFDQYLDQLFWLGEAVFPESPSQELPSVEVVKSHDCAGIAVRSATDYPGRSLFILGQGGYTTVVPFPTIGTLAEERGAVLDAYLRRVVKRAGLIFSPDGERLALLEGENLLCWSSHSRAFVETGNVSLQTSAAIKESVGELSETSRSSLAQAWKHVGYSRRPLNGTSRKAFTESPLGTTVSEFVHYASPLRSETTIFRELLTADYFVAVEKVKGYAYIYAPKFFPERARRVPPLDVIAKKLGTTKGKAKLTDSELATWFQQNLAAQIRSEVAPVFILPKNETGDPK